MIVKLEDVCFAESSSLKQSDLVKVKDGFPVYGASGFIANIDKYQQEKGYVSIVKDGAGVGRVQLCPGKSSVIGTMQYIIPKDNVLPEYLYYVTTYMHLEKYYTGATIPHIYFKDYKKEKFNLDPIEKQKKIVRILDGYRKIIELRREQLQKYDELIKSRFVEMFGDPVDNPMEWEKRQLQAIVADDCTISYGIVQTGDDQEEGVPVFRPVDIVNRVPKLDELKKTTEEISNKYKRTILKGRELLITVRANIADTCIVGEEFKGCNVGRGIVPIRIQEDIMELKFLKCLLDSKHLNDDIKSKAKGITLIQLNMEDLRKVELIIPPIEKQIEFVEFAKQVDKSKVVVQAALDKTQLLFDSLMQEYFG